ADTSVVPSSRRVRVDGLCSSRCRRLAFWRISLPLPVTLMRFLIPLWVFIFGMAALVLLALRRAQTLLLGRSCSSLVGGALGRLFRLGSSPPSRTLGLLRLCHSRPLGGTLLLGGFLVDLGVGLLLVWSQHHDHVAAVLLGRRLNEAQVLDVVRESLEQPEPELRARLLAASEHDRYLDLVAFGQEPLDVAHLGLVVVGVDLRTELLLLDQNVRLVPPSLARLHGGLVLELAVVHELGHRRARGRRHLDQIEIGLLGQS